ncbi:MAG: tRNA (adenosine(37)-N6)-threonylcarbamoyltransferase complex dimerization subunit type 1 TsaB [Leptolyngbya sp. SIO4C1]|nr:tRNA (adenosine(37)-N6)-threonylcarbamoyltransferase complex dimerization subunit type 1 TsaB [Leptolyngbya sp. SIO4C1]
MLGLALHTSSPDLGLALSNFKRETRHQVWPLGRDLSSQLHEYLMAFIAPYTWQDFSFIAVAKGPGGFTGTRIGVVTARILAQQLEIPLYGISSLAAIAQTATVDPGSAIALTMPAKRGDVYGALYRQSAAGLETILSEAVLPAADWQAKLATWETPLHPIELATGQGLGDSVTGVLSLAYAQWQQGQRSHWSEVVPFYGQHPVQLS